MKKPNAVDLAKAVLHERYQKGLKEYGVPLQPYNGRDNLQDAIEEAADLLKYLCNLKWERDHPREIHSKDLRKFLKASK